MADTPTKDELLEKCWTKWFKEDFSWDALAKKKIAGDGGLHGEKTLQDYWRRDPETGMERTDEELLEAGELVDVLGMHWHVVHLPPRLADGAETWKANLDHPDWKRVEALISARLVAARETSATFWFGSINVIGQDGRAQLTGTVQRREPRFLTPLKGGEETSDETTLHLDARFTAFLGEVNLSEARLGPAANFSNATFTADAYFGSATFAEKAAFHASTFTNIASFSATTFSGDADFSSTTFIGPAYFAFTQFLKDAWFTKGGSDEKCTMFESETDFANAEFSGVARFKGAHFHGPMRFTTVRFGRFTDFKNIEGPNREADWRNAFDGAIAFGTLDWRDAPYHMISAFSGAKLKEGVFFPRLSEEKAESTFKDDALQPALDAGDTMPPPEGKNAEPLTDEARTKERDAALAALESGAQVLKLAMDDANDTHREQRFYRFELIARSQQTTTKRAEKLFSWLYAKTADYGASLVRPPIAIASTILIFGLVFWAWGEALQAVARSDGERVSLFWNAIVFSGEQVFRPFGVWWPQPSASADPNTAQALLDAAGLKTPVALKHVSASEPSWNQLFLNAYGLEGQGWQRAAIRFVATFESLLAIVFFFLFGLAIRRRFQMD